MILSICLNPSLDTRYTAPGFLTGTITTTLPPEITAGGKALNLARVAALLGEKVTATGLVCHADLDFFDQTLREVGVTPRFVSVKSPSRRCLNIIDPTTGESTQLLEQGYPVGNQDLDAIFDLLCELIPDSSVVAASGSVPPGLPTDIYAQIGDLARKYRRPFILDARGAYLKEGLLARPFAVKPNLQELEEHAGRTLTTQAQITQALAELNADLAIVTLGREGALALIDETLYRVSQPPVEAKNSVGSGDSFGAGLALGLVRNLSLAESLTWAAAAGAANAMNAGTGRVDPFQVQRLLPQITITKPGGMQHEF